jgi:hypothetical protein
VHAAPLACVGPRKTPTSRHSPPAEELGCEREVRNRRESVIRHAAAQCPLSNLGLAAVFAKGSSGHDRPKAPPTLPVNLYDQKRHLLSSARSVPCWSLADAVSNQTRIAIGFLEPAV